MIKTENLTIGTRQLVRTYSDAGYLIERDGVKYSEAVDPADSVRVYMETDEKAPEVELDPQTALDIITGVAQ